MLVGRVVALVSLFAGCDGEPAACPAADLAPLSREPAFAVVTSDYLSSALALLDADLQLMTEAWIDSATVEPGLSTPMTGDVVLPTTPIFGNIGMLDRSNVDNMTLLSYSGVVDGQWPMTPPPLAGEAAFLANPHDIVPIDGARLLVTRFEKNLAPDAVELDRGNDLLWVDRSRGALLGRIDLAVGDTFEGGVSIVARPSGALRLAGGVLVALTRLSLDFMVAAPGAVAVVDPDAPAGTAPVIVSLAPLRNCSSVSAIPGDDTRVVVACAGATFGTADDRRAAAGLAWIHVPAGSPPALEAIWAAADHPGAPVVSSHPIALDATTALAVAMGDDKSNDRLVRVDRVSGGAEVLFESGAPYTLGSGTFDSVRQVVLLPDAEIGIRRFDLDASLALASQSVIAVSTCRKLPARQIRPLLPAP